MRNSSDTGESLWESLQDGFFEADREGRLTAGNTALGRLLGRPLDDILGRNLDELVRSRPVDWYRNPKSGTRFEWEIAALSGPARIAEGTVSAIEDPSGVVVASRGIVRDLTEHHRAATELDRSRAAAVEEARRKAEFVAQVSHDLRTPMNGIIGLTDLTLETDLTSEQREYLTGVRTSAHALLTLVNDILDFSRMDAGRFELERIPFSLRECMSDLVKPLSMAAHAKQLELLWEVASETPDSIVGDPTRLRQILVNLLDNAIKFTRQGQIVARVHPQGREGNGEGVTLCFRVSDTGDGIPTAMHDAIFEPFIQAESGGGARAGGVGLGLAISRRLVDRMGGRIWVESERGRGSAFCFTARFGVGDGTSRHTLARHEELKGVRVLLADGNATSRQILADGLRYFGLKVEVHRTAEGAWAALEAAKRAGSPYRVATIDVLLPDARGFDLARRIADESRPGGTRVILLTRSGQRGDAALCRALGVAGYLSKPVNPLDLLDTIRAVVGTATTPESAPLVTRHSLRESKPRLEILVAEDDPVNQLVIRTLLERSGHQVTLVSSGDEALEAATRQTFGLVLMDVGMPRMDGVAATRALRERETGGARRTPIIALTAHAMAGDEERFLAAGMDGYLAKPFEPGALFAVLERIADPLRAPSTGGERFEAALPEPIVDRQRLLEQAGGDPQLLRQIVELFLDSGPAMLDGVRSALERGDGPGLARAAHLIKGACGTLAARLAAEAASQIERLAAAGELAPVRQIYEQLESRVRQAEVELQALVAPLGKRPA